MRLDVRQVAVFSKLCLAGSMACSGRSSATSSIVQRCVRQLMTGEAKWLVIKCLPCQGSMVKLEGMLADIGKLPRRLVPCLRWNVGSGQVENMT